MLFEFAKLRALCVFMAYVPYTHSRLRAFAPYAIYAPSYILALVALVHYYYCHIYHYDHYYQLISIWLKKQYKVKKHYD